MFAVVFSVMRIDIVAMALSFATAIALLSGCGGGESEAAGTTSATSERPGETPTQTPGFGEPPGASLVAASGTLAGGIGTHCWANACRDMTGPVTGTALVTMQGGEQAQIVFEEPDPDEVVFRWIPAPADVPQDSGGQLLWGTLGPHAFSAPDGGPGAPAEPGRYILSVFARWDGKGDVSYGWYVEVP